MTTQRAVVMINGQPSFGAVFIRPHLLDLHAESGPAAGSAHA